MAQNLISRTDQVDMFGFMNDTDRNKVTPQESTDWKWEFKDYPKARNDLKVFSCFACGGGSTMGYKLAGCDVLGCCEIDPQMNNVYLMNHNPKYNYLMDIREFNKLDNLPEELYDLDILDGSPPCTTFSISGDREDSWGKEKVFREGQAKQTLDDLSFVFIDTVRKLKPKVVIMENVEGILLGDAYQYVERIYKEFSAAGYFLHHWLLKSEQMGVPQTRHRVFFIGIRKDLGIHPSQLDMTFNYKPITYGEIKSGVGEELNHDTVVYKWLCRSTPEDKRVSDTIVRNGEPEKLFNFRICWEHNVAQTLPANGDSLRGTEHTRISIEDILSIQTFPQDYKYEPRKYTTIKYICGMSVPPIMIKRIVQKLIEQGIFKKGEPDEKDNM